MQAHLRLRNRSDFQRLRAQGKVWRHPSLIMSVAPNYLSHNRYGFVVSKRLGKAIKRNRLRRQLRACMQSLNDKLLSGNDIVLITRQPILMLSYWELCTVINGLMVLSNLRRKDS